MEKSTGKAPAKGLAVVAIRAGVALIPGVELVNVEELIADDFRLSDRLHNIDNIKAFFRNYSSIVLIK